MRHHRRRLRAAAGGGLLVLLTACSPDGDTPTATPSESSPASTTPSSQSPTATPTTASPAPSPTSTTPSVADGSFRLALEPVVEGLEQPLLVTAPADDPRLFIVERPGRVRIVADGELLEQPFLDVDELTTTSGEFGLLGLAFHPDYASNGRFFVHYSAADDGATQLAEYEVDADDPDVADAASGRVIFATPQPASNHNGGMVAFGADGMLYLALGDGGGSGDENAQDLDSPLGSLLRLDVDSGGDAGYEVPPDNPYADGGGVPEVWVKGLRNPWRFSVDRVTGQFYIGDVGSQAWEEIDVLEPGAGGVNFGWPVMEGAHCTSDGCDPEAFIPPVHEVSHDEGVCSVIGGYVYRGSAIPELTGHYLYSDLCDGWVRSFRYVDGEVRDECDLTDQLGERGTLLSFGEDTAGELYLCEGKGTVSRIVRVG